MSILGQDPKVLESHAGYYLGTTDEDGDPLSRESAEYWPHRQQAQSALDKGEWTQRVCS